MSCLKAQTSILQRGIAISTWKVFIAMDASVPRLRQYPKAPEYLNKSTKLERNIAQFGTPRRNNNYCGFWSTSKIFKKILLS